MSTNLFISLYPEKNPVRAAELAECLRRNVACKAIDRVIIFTEGTGTEIANYMPDVSDIHIGKCLCYPTIGRPTFKNFFLAINHLTDPNDINIIANSDIYFEDLPVRPEINQCFALTRYDLQPDGSFKFLNMRDSQDTWIFRGKVRIPNYCSFCLGIAGCDNRIAMELLRAGYEVLNPSLTIKTYHIHKTPTNHDKSLTINPPYYRPVPQEL